MNISIILTAHNEGIISHHAMKSLFRAIHYAEQSGIKCEILIILDSATQDTIEYFSQYQSNKYCTIFSVNFSNVWLSKNFGIQEAKCKYITFLHANDLISQKWLVNAFNKSEQTHEDIVVHPQYEVCFDQSYKIIYSVNSNNITDLALLSGNAFPDICFAKKDIFLRFPYEIPEKKDYGDPSWLFNSEISGNYIDHIAIEESVYFSRKKSGFSSKSIERKLSFLKKLEGKKKILKKSSIFLKKIEIPKINFIYEKIIAFIKYPFNKKYMGFQLHINHKFFNQINPLPEWLIADIIDINSIEPLIQSAKYKLASSSTYDKCNFLESVSLLNLLKSYKNNSSYFAFVPFLGIGGAEKVANHYMELIKKTNNITIFTTEKTTFTEGVVQLKKMSNFFCKIQYSGIITQFLEITRPNKIYFCNSFLFYFVISIYGDFLKSFIEIYCNAFAFSYTKKTKEKYWLHSDYIGKTHDYISKIISDNKLFANQLIDTYSINKDKVICNYTPININRFVPGFSNAKELHVFWASRVCREKRLDILLKIVKKCKYLPIKFHVFGESSSRYADINLNKLRWQDNVECYGKYINFGSIVQPEFDAFLYTSESDGIPNVILEAMSFGYPVLAPNVGGIGEIVSEDTGFLIDNYEDYETYSDILKNLIGDKSILKHKQASIYKKLSSSFNIDEFVRVAHNIGIE